MNLFFTSDTHFFHNNIITKIGLRPQFKNYVDMNEHLIQCWNDKVHEDDTVYHLGDFSFQAPSTDEVINLRKRLNGKIVLITGNHEKDAIYANKKTKLFEFVTPYYELRIDPNYGTNLIVLFHYSIREWNKSYHGSWHLYGHSHYSLDEQDGTIGKSFDIGIDNPVCNYSPLSLQEVANIMNKKPIQEIDHHVGLGMLDR